MNINGYLIKPFAYLCGADLSGADLRGADLSGAQYSHWNWLPKGELIVYKKLREGVATLLIPNDAERSHGTSRKCRAAWAIVLSLPQNCLEGHSLHDPTFVYKVGETVYPRTPFDQNRWEECASGIHFFITKEEAEEYS